MRRLLAALAFALAALAATPAFGIDDPSLDYYTIETPHFYVHYYSGLEALAHKVAVTCEEAHEALVPLFNWVPRNKTHVNVIDRIDSANGSATTYGRNRINIYGMAPEPSGVLGFYDDWIRVVVYHEYVHILHMDTVLGISPYINYVIGKQLSPNQTSPRWYIEGLATYHESKRTRGGRVNGAIWQMWSRAAALDGVLFELGTATGTPVNWPFGSSAYLYGSLFLDYVFDKHGEDFGMQFNHIYGSRIVPWSLNRTSKEVSGQTLERLWEEWMAAATAKAHAERVAVIAGGRTKLNYITKIGGENGYARQRPGTDDVVFYANDFHNTPAYAVHDPDSGKTKPFLDIQPSFGPSAFSPDGRYLLYSQATPKLNVYSFQDLYRYDFDTGSKIRMTNGERAREAAVSPDGKWITYVRNVNGTMELVLRRWDHFSGDEVVLVGGNQHPAKSDARWQQIATPQFSPDSTRIVFSWWTLEDGQRDIWMYDITKPQKEALKPLTRDFAQDLDPTFDPISGNVLFASDRNGIFNIYEVDPGTLKKRRVSNVVNGVWSPEPTRDGKWIYVTSYTSKGYEIARFKRPSSLPDASQRALQDSLVEPKYPTVDTAEFKYGDYRPVKWLAPLMLTPDIGVLTSGTAFSATLSGEDPASRHIYQLATAFTYTNELEESSVRAGGFYAYTGGPVDFSVLGRISDFPSGRALFVGSEFETIQRREYSGRVALGYPILDTRDQLSITTAFTLEYLTVNDEPVVQQDPGDLEPTKPESYFTNELLFSVFYSNLERYARSVSTEQGITADVGFSVQDPTIGSEFERLTMTYRATGYLPNPWIDRHVFALGLRGGMSAAATGPGSVFSVGGALPQDVLSSIIFQEPTRRQVLPGYPPGIQRGSTYQSISSQYRFPLLDFDKGFGTLPVFFRQLKGAAYFDTATAYNGFLGDAEYLKSAGAEVLLSTTFAYYFTGNLRMGYAYGFDTGGIHDFYFVYGGGF